MEDYYRPNWLGNLKHSQGSQHLSNWPAKGMTFPHSGAAPHDSHNSTVYTSDYGSYSSQESNHSGNSAIYSNFADCEEALSNLDIPYEVTPPPPPPKMSARKTKPLPPVPPPRKDSRARPQEKKMSLDDMATVRGQRLGEKKEDSAPSFATLPRKKKSAASDSPTKTPSHTASQVTWMKEIVQKAESAPRNGASNGKKAATKVTHGILKNGGTTPRSDASKSSYISRDAVQRVMEQQKKASSRKATNTLTPSPSHKSAAVPAAAVPAATAAARRTDVNKKPWEYNPASYHGSSIQVLGVIEPSTPGDADKPVHHHIKQNSAETEFEFPPPPSETDIAQILTSTDERRHGSHHSSQWLSPASPAKHTASHVPRHPSHQSHCDNDASSDSTFDVVLPPPPEFQEPRAGPSTDYMSQQTYGDYELLSPDAGYDYDPWKVQPHADGRHGNGRVNGYRVPLYNSQSHLQNRPDTTKLSPRASSAHQTSRTLNRAYYNIARHAHQYSTEL